MLINEVNLAVQKAGGTAVQNIDIPIPENATLARMFLKHLDAVPIINSLFIAVILKAGGIDYSKVNPTAIINLNGLPAGSFKDSGATIAMASDVFRWQIQAHAVTTTNFALRICFYDVTY